MRNLLRNNCDRPHPLNDNRSPDHRELTWDDRRRGPMEHSQETANKRREKSKAWSYENVVCPPLLRSPEILPNLADRARDSISHFAGAHFFRVRFTGMVNIASAQASRNG